MAQVFTKNNVTEQINEITPPAVKYLVRLLSKRDYSEFRLRQKLKEKQYEQDELEFAINYVKDKNWLREENYTKARIQAFVKKGLAHQHIIQKLKLEKIVITSSDIDEVSLDIGVDSEALLNEMLRKKFGKFDLQKLKEPNQKAKMIRFLMTKGHSYDEIRPALQEFLGSYEDSDY